VTDGFTARREAGGVPLGGERWPVGEAPRDGTRNTEEAGERVGQTSTRTSDTPLAPRRGPRGHDSRGDSRFA
jgi:hypothetical protein